MFFLLTYLSNYLPNYPTCINEGWADLRFLNCKKALVRKSQVKNKTSRVRMGCFIEGGFAQDEGHLRANLQQVAALSQRSSDHLQMAYRHQRVAATILF